MSSLESVEDFLRRDDVVKVMKGVWHCSGMTTAVIFYGWYAPDIIDWMHNDPETHAAAPVVFILMFCVIILGWALKARKDIHGDGL